MNIHYEGFFILNDLDSELAKPIQYKHVTTEYRPKETHTHLYGKIANFAIIGYGCDGINEGYKVALLSCEDEELEKLYFNIPVPHITLSISSEGKAKDTCNLNFKDYHNGTIIKGIFGGFCEKPILR